VHMRISCPPHKFACYYGIDFPDPEKLLANQCTMDEIRGYLGADSIGYLDFKGMIGATGRPAETFCTACFSGDYPVPYDAAFDKLIMEKRLGRIRLLEKEEPRLL
jgi:amidophosphoribosyltransferase